MGKTTYADACGTVSRNPCAQQQSVEPMPQVPKASASPAKKSPDADDEGWDDFDFEEGDAKPSAGSSAAVG